MNGLEIVAVLLIAGGIVALVYGGITYTRSTHGAEIGPFELSVKDQGNGRHPGLVGRRCDRDRRGTVLRA